jgi:protein-tyrosine kinase
MSLIEQAAKRLEELKRAGIEVPLAPIPPNTGAAGAGIAPTSSPGLRSSEPSSAIVKTVSPAPYEPINPLVPSKRSREVSLDLVRLERDGYLVPAKARSQLAEQLRIIKRPLLANARGEGAQVVPRANLIQVVSALPGEGKTFFAMNLAMSIAMEVDHSVLLIDADVLRPSVLARCGVEQALGLMDVLLSKDLELADVMLRTNVPKLSLLPAGTASAKSTELLASAAMETLLDELAAKYSDRIIVFDAPPVIPTTESRVLASRVGQVVMVVEANKTTHAQVTQAYAALEDCPVVLTVLNKTTASGSGDSYGYYYAQ